MQCPRCQQENLTSHKCCRECGTPLAHLEGGAQPAPSYADLQRFLTEARDQQAATSEILRVISRSRTNLQPVLDAIATNAALVCDAYDAVVFLREGDRVRPAAHYGPINITLQHSILSRDSVSEVAILDREPVHVHDLLATEPSAFPRTTKAARQGGYRTALSVPLLGENKAIGALAIRRREIQPFTTQQIELLQTFAAQAVIALENARLFTEAQEKNRALTQAHAQVTEALEQQTATAEILKVISQSPTDVQPVFDTIVQSAVRLCGAVQSNVQLFDGELMHWGAQLGIGPETMESIRRVYPMRPDQSQTASRAVLTGSVVHLPDVLDDPEYRHELALKGGWRGVLSVPMIRQEDPIGAITVARLEPGAFSETQIALLQTFADQAVIAIENARLFKETKNALEQQTATAEILRVISRSPTGVQPTFEAIARAATSLCEADLSGLYPFDGALIHFGAQHGRTPDEVDAAWQAFPQPPSRLSVTARAILAAAIVQVADVSEDPEIADPLRIYRTVLSVPMLRDDRPVGAITVARRVIRPFSHKQIALLQAFADQAVIAIENVRLFTELQEKNRALTQAHAQMTEALEQQTATSEILGVISRAPAEVEPVFHAIVTRAARLCEANDVAMFLVEGEDLRAVAGVGPLYASLPSDLRIRLTRDSAATRAVVDRATVHIHDFAAESEAEYPVGRELARRFGHRSMLAVPLLREGVPIGVICAFRFAVRPFPEQQVALLRTFADQAVIAIENVRLFEELEARNRDLTESLEQQTATSEILRVISNSPTNIQPVLDTLAETAARLCKAYDVSIRRVDGDVLRLAAHHGPIPQAVDVIPVIRGTTGGRSVLDRQTIHIADAQAETREFPEGSAQARQLGHRTILTVPLLREGLAIGTINLRRVEVLPFTDKQITLLQTFADQAVIAIENVRLFTELQEKNRALTEAHAQVTEALEQQTATSEILRAIAHTQTDVQPVFDTIVRSAAGLCHATTAAVFLSDGRMLYHPANYGGSPAALAAARARYPRALDMETVPGMAILTRSVVHVPDIDEQPVIEVVREIGRALGFRSIVAVPMVREGEAFGAILVTRRKPGRFSDGEVELLKTFADQAVIAVENVRLFKELEARTAALTRSVDQLTALGEVGRAVSSTLDLETVLITIVSRAVQLSGLDGGVVFEYDEGAEAFVQRAATETGGALAEIRRTTPIRKGEGALGRTAITLEPVQVPDITVPAAYESRLRDNLIESGIRAILAVPMVYEGRLIGCLGVTRNRPGGFPAETIDLLRTFATQSALAIQNARLFREIADKSRQLEAASRHKSEFLANMSHELRTPLNAVIGFSEVLLQRMFGELNDKQDEYLKDIYASGQHLLSLINDILDLSKIEAGRMELAPAPFHLPSALDNAVTLVKERAARHGMTLQVDVDPRLGEIVGDERKVKQVLLNLLSNAVKFTPEGGRITLKARRTDGAVEIAVTDTGIGIAPEDQAAIFEEFRQVGSDETRKQEGTGLGLTLAKKFIELHGGRIWVESEPGRGSTFTFTLPVH